MSAPDLDAEPTFANLVRQLTGYPLMGITDAGRDQSWSARHWDHVTGLDVSPTDCENVRVVGDHLDITWDNERVRRRTPARVARNTRPRYALTSNCGSAYARIGDKPRRLFNTAVFNRLAVRDGRIFEYGLRTPFDLLFGMPRFEYGSLVELPGIEPGSPNASIGLLRA